MTFLFSNLNFLEVLQKFLKVQQLGECYNGPPLSHTWIKALACTHFAFSTVTLSPFLVAKHAAWSLKWMAFKTVERFLTLSRLATKQYCSSSSGTRWVRRGMDGPPHRRFGERDAALPNFRKPERRTTDLASVLMGLATSIRNRLSRERESPTSCHCTVLNFWENYLSQNYGFLAFQGKRSDSQGSCNWRGFHGIKRLRSPLKVYSAAPSAANPAGRGPDSHPAHRPARRTRGVPGTGPCLQGDVWRLEALSSPSQEGQTPWASRSERARLTAPATLPSRRPAGHRHHRAAAGLDSLPRDRKKAPSGWMTNPEPSVCYHRDRKEARAAEPDVRSATNAARQDGGDQEEAAWRLGGSGKEAEKESERYREAS